jgi:hypothetical protein
MAQWPVLLRPAAPVQVLAIRTNQLAIPGGVDSFSRLLHPGRYWPTVTRERLDQPTVCVASPRRSGGRTGPELPTT